MDKQEYLQKIAEAAFQDELEKVGAGKIKGGIDAMKRSFGHLGRSIVGQGKKQKGVTEETAKYFRERGMPGVADSVVKENSRMGHLGKSGLALGTVGGLGLAGGGGAYLATRKKK